MFTVIVFHDGRNDYLEQTLATFVEQVTFPSPPFKVLIDDMPDGRDTDYLHKIAARFRFDHLILNPENLGSFGAIMAAWSHLPPRTEFVFHLENDFVFHRPVDVRELTTVLEEPWICNITLLRQPWYGDEIELGGIFGVEPERFREETVRGIPVCLHQTYFGHNPGLYRREFARVIPNTSRSVPGEILSHERVYRDLLLREDPSRHFAILGRRTDPPRTLHIGHRRVGETPNYEPDLPELHARSLPSENDQLEREHAILVKRLEILSASRTGSVSRPLVDVTASGTGLSALRQAFDELETKVLAGRASEIQNQGVILMYHRVAALAPDVAGLCVPPDFFRSQMEHLARTYEPVDLASLAGATSDHPRRAVAITFDDGYLDTFTASDILRDLGMPATFFVNSSAGGETFIDSLSRVFLEGAPLPKWLDLSMPAIPLSTSCADETDRRAAFDFLRDIGYQLPEHVRRELLFALYRWSGVDPAPRTTHRIVTPGELRELASRPGHSIGAHTENHLWLPAQPRSVKIREIAVNRRYLQDVLGQKVLTFAYPYGAHDEETVRLCRSLGFQFAVTVKSGAVRPWHDPLLLPRVEVKPQTADQFAAMMASLWN